MALNLDAALRVVAKVSGLNEFKALTDGLRNVEGASKASGTGLQQLSAESNRLTQEAAKSTGSVKAQAAALQELQTRTRAGAADMRRMGEETKGLGSAVTQLRGQSTGALDGLAGGATKAANGIRQLQGVVQPTDEALARLREEVLAYGAANKQTERSLEQQVQALKNLRSQAELNGELYGQLSDDMQRLTAASKGLGDASMFGVEGLKKLGTASQASAQSVELQIKSLERLQSTLVKGGEGYRAIGKEIDTLKQKAAGLDLAKGLAVPGGGLGVAASGITGAMANIRKLRQELNQSYPGRVVLAGEGLAAAGLAGKAGAGVVGGLGGMAASAGAVAGSLDSIAAKAQALPAIVKPLGNLLAGPAADAAAAVAQWGAQLSAAQAKIAALSGPFEAVGHAISTIGPQGAAAAGAASLAIASVYQILSNRADKAQAEAEQAFKGISDDAQRALENLARLMEKVPAARMAAQQRIRDTNLQKLGELDPASLEARQAANAVVVAEREIAKIKTEQNALLEQARQRENAGAEAIKRQTELARQRLQVQQQITAAVKAEQAQYADDRAIRNSIRRNQERLERERARAERDQADLRDRAAAAFAPSATLALPAAGQTSAPGTGRAISGGARASLAGIEIAGTRDTVGAAMAGFSGEAKAALNQQAEATNKARESLSKLFIEIDKVEAASNGSVQSLQKQRSAWEALRTAVNPAAPAYEKARAKVQELDEQLKKLTVTQEKSSRRGLGREAVGGALGALVTGGGPQAALGSLAGSLAFSGGAAGLAAGGAVTAIAGAAGLATRVGLEAESAQVRLKALTDQFGEYNQAQASAANIARTLRIGNTEAQASFANLYAALRPTGVSIKELEDAYIGFSAAARNSGATAQETSNALIQLKQGLASGALQGEELRSIREQAPLVAQAIAKQFGVMNKDVDVSIGNLKEFAAEGKITTDVVLQALAKLRQSELEKLGPQFNTGEQALKDFQIALENMGKRLAEIFGPTALAALRAFTGLLERTNELLNGDYADKTQLRLRARMQAGREALDKFSLSDRITKPGEYRAYFLQREKELTDRLLAEREARLAKEKGADRPNADQLANQENAAAARKAAQERTAREEAKKRLAEELKIREDAEKRLGDAVKQRDQQLRDFRLETIKRAKDLERQLSDQRLQIEREIEASQRASARAREDRALEQELQARRARGESTSGIEEARAINELFRQFEDQVTQQRQTAADRQVSLQRQLEEFKVSIAEGIGKIQEAYARSVSSILQDAGDKLAQKMEKGAQNAAATLGGVTPGGTGGGNLGPDQLMPGTVGKGSLNVNQLVQLARGAGFRGKDAAVMAAIAMAESGGRSQALNNNPKTGDLSYGLWQINMLGGMGPARRRQFGIGSNDALYDPAMNAKAARQVYESQGFGAWSVFKSGAYRAYMPSAEQAASNGSARRLIGGGSELDRARAGVANAGAQLSDATARAQAESRRASFDSLMGGIDSRYSAATAELDAQARSAREKLEDERMYQMLLSQGVTPELAQQRVELERIATTERERLTTQAEEIDKKIKSGQYSKEEIADLEAQRAKIQERIDAQGRSIAMTEQEIEATKRLRKAREEAEGRDIGKGFKDGVKGYLDSIGTLADGVKDATSSALKGLEDQLVNFVTTGKANFKELARSILADMARIAIQQLVLKPILGALFPSADGNVFAPGGVVPYALGGVVTRPTIFPFADGGGFRAGIMGEAGPEAILPLKRGRDGKLGVINTARGGGVGSTSVVVNVDASGSQVQGDAGRGEQLGRVISQAVQAELIKQKRPGGLLAA